MDKETKIKKEKPEKKKKEKSEKEIAVYKEKMVNK